MKSSISNALLLLPAAVIAVLGNSLNIMLLLAFGITRNWDIVQQFVMVHNFIIVIDIAKTIVFLFTVFQINWYIGGLQEPQSVLNDFQARPMLFPCRTAHTRLFPKTHSFSYSYLMVGIPVGWKGSTGGMVSGDLYKTSTPWYLRWLSLKPGNTWFTVNGDDYLARGHVDGGIEEKLQTYLRSQNEDPKDYPYTYLLTAPRFLGYSSNPVSIWNLYSESKELKAVILEVNNTFGERHIYYLKQDPFSLSTPVDSHSSIPKPPRFTNSWPKDFYVSVFNSRKGSYSISASDPLYPSLTGAGLVNTTITLSSSKSHTKLIARVYSTSPALDPAAMTIFQKTAFIASWWWVGFATFPRTVKEAILILWKRRLHWVFRPEPRRNTMPRYADALEVLVESTFRMYLRCVVERSEKPVVLRYTPAGLIDTSDEVIVSPSAQLFGQADIEELELRVLTPIFYSRFVRYCQSLDGLLSECYESAAVYISKPDILSSFSFDFGTPRPSGETSHLDKLRFAAIKILRKRPVPIENLGKKRSNTECPSSPSNTKNLSSQSELDDFVLSHTSTERQRDYAAKLMKLFMAEYIAFGWMYILDLEIFIIRCSAAWVLAGRVLG